MLWCLTSSTAVLAALGEHRIEQWAGADAARRHSAFRNPCDGADHLAVRALARALLAATAPGTHPLEWALTQKCDKAGCNRPEAHGRPLAEFNSHAGPAVSWSHSSGMLACAVAPGIDRIGIDVETVTSDPPPIVSSWREWVRAEALVKAGFSDLDTAIEYPRTHPIGRVLLTDETSRCTWLNDLDVPELEGTSIVGALAMRMAAPADVVSDIALSDLLARVFLTIEGDAPDN